MILELAWVQYILNNKVECTMSSTECREPVSTDVAE